MFKVNVVLVFEEIPIYESNCKQLIKFFRRINVNLFEKNFSTKVKERPTVDNHFQNTLFHVQMQLIPLTQINHSFYSLFDKNNTSNKFILLKIVKQLIGRP